MSVVEATQSMVICWSRQNRLRFKAVFLLFLRSYLLDDGSASSFPPRPSVGRMGPIYLKASQLGLRPHHLLFQPTCPTHSGEWPSFCRVNDRPFSSRRPSLISHHLSMNSRFLIFLSRWPVGWVRLPPQASVWLHPGTHPVLSWRHMTYDFSVNSSLFYFMVMPFLDSLCLQTVHSCAAFSMECSVNPDPINLSSQSMRPIFLSGSHGKRCLSQLFEEFSWTIPNLPFLLPKSLHKAPQWFATSLRWKDCTLLLWLFRRAHYLNVHNPRHYNYSTPQRGKVLSINWPLLQLAPSIMPPWLTLSW